MENLKPRIRNGKVSETHFLYTDKKGKEWSVLNFGKMMEKAPEYDARDFGYSWEGMYFGDEEVENTQYRGNSSEEVLKQIDTDWPPKNTK